MKLSRTLVAFSLVGVLLLPSGCLNLDPGPIYEGPSFLIQQVTSSTGTVTNYIQANLLNGTSIYKEVQEGAMTVNGEPMRMAIDSNKLPYFYVETPSIEFKKTYTFQIPLKDGTTGSGVIITPDNGLTTLTVPTSASAQTDMPISWNPSNHAQMDLTLLFKTTSAENEVFGTIFSPSAAQIASGNFMIPRVALNRTGATHVRIILRGINPGSTENFNSGAEALSIMRIEKVVEFK